MGIGNTLRDKLAARFHTFEEYVEADEIDPEAAGATRELVHAYDERHVTVAKPWERATGNRARSTRGSNASQCSPVAVT